MSYTRIRPSNQVTLPEEVRSALHVEEGDILEVSTSGNAVVLRPTRIMPVGSPEAEEEEFRAEQDIRDGRYQTFESVESFAESLGLSENASTGTDVTDHSVVHLVTEALNEANGNAAAAMESLDRARRSLDPGWKGWSRR